MKIITTIFTVLVLVWAAGSEAARISCNTHDADWNWFTTVCDTTTGDIDTIRLPYISAVADDGTYYATQHELFWPEIEGEQCRYVQRIVRLVGPALIPEGSFWETVYEEELVYDPYPEMATYVNEDGDIVEGELMVCYARGGLRFQDLEVRDIDEAGNHRLYISQACGACDTKTIHYIDAGVKSLYYDLETAPIGVASCEGRLSSYWAGDFYFDDDDNLFISSGNHVPSALFRIGGAELDEVTGPVEQIFEHRSDMMDFVFEDDTTFYFHSVRGPDINQGNLETGDVTLVFSNPGDARITDLVKYLPEEREGGAPIPPGPGHMMKRPIGAGKRLLPSEMAARRVPPRPSDILISEIEIDKPFKATDQVDMRIPVRISLINRGRALSEAVVVRVGVQVPDQKKPQLVPFYIAGHKDKDQAIHGLGYQQEVAMAGFVEIPPQLVQQIESQGGEISLVAIAQRCGPNDKQINTCITEDVNTTSNSKVFKLRLP